MNSFLVSAAVVAVAEIGDKTQLLALVLAAKFRKPIPLILAILVATVVNHTAAAAVGTWLTRIIGPDVMVWLLGISFIAMGIWTLIPDTPGLDDDKLSAKDGWGVFGTAAAAFSWSVSLKSRSPASTESPDGKRPMRSRHVPWDWSVDR